MKIIPSRRALVVLAVCLALAAPAGYLLGRFYTEVIRVQMLDRENRAALLLSEATTASATAPDKAVKLLQTLRQEYPESYEGEKPRSLWRRWPRSARRRQCFFKRYMTR